MDWLSMPTASTSAAFAAARSVGATAVVDCFLMAGAVAAYAGTASGAIASATWGYGEGFWVAAADLDLVVGALDMTSAVAGLGGDCPWEMSARRGSRELSAAAGWVGKTLVFALCGRCSLRPGNGT